MSTITGKTAAATAVEEHTAEPWRDEFEYLGGYDCMSDAVRIVTADGDTLAVVDVAHYTQRLFGRGGGVASERAAAEALARINARRIVACVNACEGIATADLESARFVLADDETPVYELVKE